MYFLFGFKNFSFRFFTNYFEIDLFLAEIKAIKERHKKEAILEKDRGKKTNHLTKKKSFSLVEQCKTASAIFTFVSQCGGVIKIIYDIIITRK